MNVEKELHKICDQYHGELIIEDSKKSSGMGTFFHYIKYYINIPYNDCKIAIMYDNGISSTSTYDIIIHDINSMSGFELSTISHFTKLILFKKHNWKLHCKDLNLKREIKQLLQKHKLEQLIQRTAFEPSIKGIHTNTTYTINTLFSLNFSENVSSIKSIVEFHIELIDIIKKQYQ